MCIWKPATLLTYSSRQHTFLLKDRNLIFWLSYCCPRGSSGPPGPCNQTQAYRPNWETMVRVHTCIFNADLDPAPSCTVYWYVYTYSTVTVYTFCWQLQDKHVCRLFVLFFMGRIPSVHWDSTVQYYVTLQRPRIIWRDAGFEPRTDGTLPISNNIFSWSYNYILEELSGSGKMLHLQYSTVSTSVVDPELLPGSWSGIIVPDPIRTGIQQKMKEQINKNLISNLRPVNYGLCVL